MKQIVKSEASTTKTEVVYEVQDEKPNGQNGQNRHGIDIASLQNKLAIHFEDVIFKILPNYLQGYDTITSSKHQRDVVFLTDLAILSASLPEVFCLMDGMKTFSNLYFLIYAPPASDKGKVSVMARIADGLESHLSGGVDLSYDLTLLSDHDRRNTTIPKGFLLDGDSSLVAMIDALSRGKENLLFDSEAIILSQTRKNDWSQLDPILRKAFHFERISIARKDRAIRIPDPRVSLLISGTNNDAKELAGSIQGGLVSRILPYTFNSPFEWRSQFSNEASNIPGYISKKSELLVQVYEYNLNNPFEFKLTEAQIQKHDSTFGAWTKLLDNMEEFGSLKRLGVASARIAMILTALRRWEQTNSAKIIYCDDDIFDVSISIAETFHKQTDIFYDLIRNAEPVSLTRIQKVLTSLPVEFTKSDFIATSGKITNVKEDSAIKQLYRLHKANVIENINQGKYRKVS